MKNFEVEYIVNGKRQKMFLQANDKNSARTLAKQKKAGVIVKVGETQTLPLNLQLEDIKDKFARLLGLGSKIKIPNLVASVRQLSVMTNAGISIHDSIKEVANSTEDRRLKTIFATMNDDLNSGLSLTESSQRFKNELGDIVIAMINLGENTGNMAEALSKLAKMLNEIWENQRKFKKAMRYPITILVVLAIAFLVLILAVVPKFREIFEELGADLPVPTKMLLATESALSNYGLYILAGFIFIIYSIIYLYKHNDEFKRNWDKYILKVYLFGKIIFYSTMSRFMLIFTELVRAGIPIADALETAVLMVDNTELNAKLSTVRIAVGQGVSLTEAFKNTELYEGMLIQMISAGEQSGSLDKMLGNVSDYFKMKFDEIIDNISSYIEPILLFVMACMVLLLALGIFMPMWDLGKAVKG